MDTKNLPSPEAVAHHEAGHALAYLACGYSFRYLTLRPKRRDLCLGKVQVPHRRIDGRSAAMVELCGPVAEIAHEILAWGEDLATWTDVQETACNFTRSNLEYPEIWQADKTFPLESLDVQAEKAVFMLTANWRHVSAVASAALASPRALSCRRVLEIMGAGSVDEAGDMLVNAPEASGAL